MRIPARIRSDAFAICGAAETRMAIALCSLLWIGACAPTRDVVLGPSETSAFTVGPHFGRVRFDFTTAHTLLPSSNFWISDGEQLKVTWDSYGLDFTFDPQMPCTFPDPSLGFSNTDNCKRCDFCRSPPGEGCDPLLAPPGTSLVPRLLSFPGFLAGGPGQELAIPNIAGGCAQNGGFAFTPEQNATYRLMQPAAIDETVLQSAQVLVVKAQMAQQATYELETNVGFALLSAADLKDSGSLVVALRAPNRGSIHGAVSARIVSQLSAGTRALLASYRDRRTPTRPHPSASDALKDALVFDLNEILKGPSLFEEGRFARVPLMEETRELIARRPRGADLVRLNRLLIEDTYPGTIARIPLWFRGTVPGDPLLDNFSTSLLATKARILIGDRGTNPATGRLEQIGRAHV